MKDQHDSVTVEIERTRPTREQMLKAMAQAADEQRRVLAEFSTLQNEEDAGNYRNLLKARTMIALGDKDPIWQMLVDAFEERVKAQVRSVVGGS